MKIEKLTQKQKDLIPVIRDKWLGYIRTLEFDEAGVRKGVEWLYEFSGFKKPEIIIVDSPQACQITANLVEQTSIKKAKETKNLLNVKLKDIKYFQFSHYGNIWDYCWLAYQEYFLETGLIKKYEKQEEWDKFKALLLSGVYDMIQLEEVCIVSKLPSTIHLKSENGKLHCTDEHAVIFKDGYKQAYLEGIFIKNNLFKKFLKGMTFKEVMSIKNIEQRYAILSGMDKKKLLKDSGAKLISDTKRGNKLFVIEGVIEGKVVKVLNYKCPSTQREYFKYVNNRFDDADEAQAYYHHRTLLGYANVTQES